MSEYVEASQKARQAFFLVMLLLVGAMGILIQWEGRISQQEAKQKPIVEMMKEAINGSHQRAVYESIGQLPFLAFGLWFGIRILQQRRWPIRGMPMPFRTKVKHYQGWQASILAAIVILFPIVFTGLAWLKHEQRVAFYTEIINDALRPENAAQQGAAADVFELRSKIPYEPAALRRV